MRIVILLALLIAAEAVPCNAFQTNYCFDNRDYLQQCASGLEINGTCITVNLSEPIILHCPDRQPLTLYANPSTARLIIPLYQSTSFPVGYRASSGMLVNNMRTSLHGWRTYKEIIERNKRFTITSEDYLDIYHYITSQREINKELGINITPQGDEYAALQWLEAKGRQKDRALELTGLNSTHFENLRVSIDEIYPDHFSRLWRHIKLSIRTSTSQKCRDFYDLQAHILELEDSLSPKILTHNDKVLRLLIQVVGDCIVGAHLSNSASFADLELAEATRQQLALAELHSEPFLDRTIKELKSRLPQR